MDASELRARARQEADELGPEPPGTEVDLWREERWGAVVLLAGLADDDAELLCTAANYVADEWTDREAGPVVAGHGDRRRDRRLSELRGLPLGSRPQPISAGTERCPVRSRRSSSGSDPSSIENGAGGAAQ
jgi:hypothetical protein